MPEYKCKRCGKCLSTNQKLKQHLNKKKPCVNENIKTKYQCERCLKYWTTSQKLNNHINRKNKCEIFRHTPKIETKLEKEIDFQIGKEKMIKEMKKEFKIERIKLYKKIVSNTYNRQKFINRLTKKFNSNMNNLNNRKTLPDVTPSILEKEEIKINNPDKLLKYYIIVKKRISNYEEIIQNLDDENDENMINMEKIINSNFDDMKKIYEIKKYLKKIFKTDTASRIKRFEDELIEDERIKNL